MGPKAAYGSHAVERASGWSPYLSCCTSPLYHITHRLRDLERRLDELQRAETAAYHRGVRDGVRQMTTVAAQQIDRLGTEVLALLRHTRPA